jgi:hypothetical protein
VSWKTSSAVTRADQAAMDISQPVRDSIIQRAW